MKVEVFHHGQSMGGLRVDNLEYLERYLLRWFTHPIQMVIKFESLREQILWYAGIVDLIGCVQTAQKSSGLVGWKVSILRFDQIVTTVVKQVA